LPLGVTGAMHRATSLRAAVPPAATPVLAALPPGSIALPPAAPTSASVLDVIAARRSVRRFAQTPLALDALSGVLAGMAVRSAPLLSAAVRVDVVVNAVAGVLPGAYRYEATPHALVPQRASADLRAAAHAAALDQDVIGDAAAVFVLSIDRAAFAADPTGPARGYRHAFLEAGLVGERVYIEAGARGLGACAVGAFYDEEAAALVAIDPAREWVVHFAALGVPSS
jgi:SagB-type dehydrogenase family enzyme